MDHYMYYYKYTKNIQDLQIIDKKRVPFLIPL